MKQYYKSEGNPVIYQICHYKYNRLQINIDNTR